MRLLSEIKSEAGVFFTSGDKLVFVLEGSRIGRVVVVAAKDSVVLEMGNSLVVDVEFWRFVRVTSEKSNNSKRSVVTKGRTVDKETTFEASSFLFLPIRLLKISTSADVDGSLGRISARILRKPSGSCRYADNAWVNNCANSRICG